jgi:hypothetical protein
MEFHYLVRKASIKAQAKPEIFQKSLILLKTVNKKDHHFHDLVATLR